MLIATQLCAYIGEGDYVGINQNVPGVKCIYFNGPKLTLTIYANDPQAIEIRNRLLELFPLANGEVEPVDGAHASADVLDDESHCDDDTVLSGEIPASDSDAAVMESSL